MNTSLYAHTRIPRMREQIKLLFLDWDGVVSSGGIGATDSMRLSMISSIVEETGCKVVLISHMRRFVDLKHAMVHMLQEVGVELFGATPTFDESLNIPRGDEIRTWLRDFHKNQGQYEESHMVILDDDPRDEITGILKPFLVRTESTTGLTREITERVIEMFNTPTQGHAGSK